MQYRTLGRTGIKVSPYALGTLMYATRKGNAPGESARIIHKALDADINFLDTADAYGGYEEVVGEARGLPDAMIEAIAAGKRPEFETGQEASAYDFTWQLTHHAVDGATYARAAREFGQAGMVDMVVLTGLYLTVCAIVNAFKVPVPAGTQPESSAP